MATRARRRESTKERGRRLNEEGKARRIDAETFEVVGETGEYLLKKRGSFWVCPCPSRKGDCSHVEAVHAARDEEMRAETRQQSEEEKAAFLRSVGHVSSALGIEEGARDGYAYDYEDEDEDEYGVEVDEQGRLFVL